MLVTMRKYILSSAAAGVAFAASLAFGAVVVSALTVQPVLIDDLKMSPGETATRAVKLTNESAQTVQLKPAVYDVEPSDDETGFPKTVSRSEESTLANWISAGGEVTIKPNETVIVPVVVTVPANGEPGGHYALVTWGASQTANPKGPGAAVAGQIGVNFALDVKGAVTEKGDLVSFGTSNGEGKFDSLPVKFTARVSNSGNRHFKPKGDVVVTNMFGKVVATLPLTGATGGNVLPKSTRAFDVQWDGAFAFGKYTATVNALFGKAGSASGSIDFWVLPIGLLILWLVIAVVVVLILALLVKNISASMKK